MATIHFTTTTTATPEQFIADVTEGDHHRLQHLGRRLGGHLHIRPAGRRHDGIDVVVVREGKNLEGRAIGALLGLVGKRLFTGQFEKTVKAVEAHATA